MTTGTETVAEELEHAEAEVFNAGDLIMHHIIDGREIENPFTGTVYTLPIWEVWGVDISLSRNIVMMWIASAILLVLVALAVRRVREPVPRGLRSVFEIFALYIRDEVARKAIGEGADRYVNYLLTTFFFILACNLFGLVPGMATATGSISVTAALALLAFAVVQASGIRKFGVVQHFKNLIPHGVPWWIVPLLIPIELLSMFARPFALCIRLFANMTAGHVVIIALVSLIFVFKTAWVATVAVPFVLFIDLLELLIGFIQAFIFTMLTALFIGLSVNPAH